MPPVEAVLVLTIYIEMSASTCVAELEAKLLTARSRLRTIKQEHQKDKRAQAAAARTKRHHLDVATTIMTLRDGRLEAALCYCDMKAIDMEEARHWLESCLLHAPLDELVKRLHCEGAQNKRLVKSAQAFLGEWDLAAWVRSCNDQEGIAPLYENVFSQKLDQCHINEQDCRQPRTNQRNSKIQWVRRFKRRWNGAFGSVKKQNGLSEGELRKQADGVLRRFFFSHFGNVFWDRFWAQKMGTFLVPVSTVVYKMGPVF